MTFSEQLMYYRKQNSLSQEQLGEKIGVSRQSVSKWELGDTTPEMEKLILLSDLFHISIDELTGRTVNDNFTQDSAYAGGSSRPSLHYEYKSKKELWGLPLIHINIGTGSGICCARGIIAIGMIARGLISFGCLSSGLVSVGACSLGLLSLGGVSLGLLLSAGGLSIGALAFGGLAIGIFATGGLALGFYSIGGAAFGLKAAAGDYANAPIAIGNWTEGQTVFSLRQHISGNAVYQVIQEKYPATPEFIKNIFKSLVENGHIGSRLHW